MRMWDWLLGLLAIYTAVYTPLSLVFSSIRWNLDDVFNHIVDCLFIVDILVKMRTMYHDRGYAVTAPRLVMQSYLESSFRFDFLAAVPFDQIVMAFAPSRHHDTVLWCGGILRLLRLRRCRSLMRLLDYWWNINIIKIVSLMATFLLLAHWFGLAFLSIAIQPLIDSGDTSEPWWWLTNDNSFVGKLYICGVYWALSVMTNLKPLAGTESRDCYYSNSHVPRPLEERVFTICVFLVGALFFSTIYGNIQIFVSRINKINDRFSNRMFEVNEFIALHGLTNALANKIRSFVEFSFLATKGINVDYISDQLPPYLQVEITTQLNRRVVESVKIFAGCPRDFIQSLVHKLVPSICVVGDNIVSQGEMGDCLYFIRRGIAEVVIKGNKVVASLHEGDYFGEIALIRQEKRSADVRASTDCMLLSLSHDDLEDALKNFPHIRARIEMAANERLAELKRLDNVVKSSPLPVAARTFSKETKRPSRGAIAALIDAPNFKNLPSFEKQPSTLLCCRAVRSIVSAATGGSKKRVMPKEPGGAYTPGRDSVSSPSATRPREDESAHRASKGVAPAEAARDSMPVDERVAAGEVGAPSMAPSSTGASPSRKRQGAEHKGGPSVDFALSHEDKTTGAPSSAAQRKPAMAYYPSTDSNHSRDGSSNTSGGRHTRIDPDDAEQRSRTPVPRAQRCASSPVPGADSDTSVSPPGPSRCSSTNGASSKKQSHPEDTEQRSRTPMPKAHRHASSPMPGADSDTSISPARPRRYSSTIDATSKKQSHEREKDRPRRFSLGSAHWPRPRRPSSEDPKTPKDRRPLAEIQYDVIQTLLQELRSLARMAEKEKQDRALRDRQILARMDRMGNIIARQSHIRSTWD
ncbi:hypothetical protein AB1Y20_012136 [Prymnesium parvum]|uniref:Cyclic nucleotide-binding domain-containing protein n=1 Tax=Prymnesium parvum TaxID=97485 RepID=A0AB34IR86_PRYPA